MASSIIYNSIILYYYRKNNILWNNKNKLRNIEFLKKYKIEM